MISLLRQHGITKNVHIKLESIAIQALVIHNTEEQHIVTIVEHLLELLIYRITNPLLILMTTQHVRVNVQQIDHLLVDILVRVEDSSEAQVVLGQQPLMNMKIMVHTTAQHVQILVEIQRLVLTREFVQIVNMNVHTIQNHI